VDHDPEKWAPPLACGQCHGERVHEQGLRDHPRHVQVVEGEEQAVDEPVRAAEGAHPEQQQPTEQQFLAEGRVEDELDDQDGEQDPVAG
jgi:hypothetical protein